MKFRRQANQEVSVNLTPLIDVVFLLLIFFMVSTTFTKETELEIDLPEADGQQADREADRVEMEISADGNYLINGERLGSADRDSLMERVREVSGDDTSMPFVITADAKTSHELVVRAMDVAGSLGFTGLSISTERTPVNDSE